jgi:hypothetical protein
MGPTVEPRLDIEVADCRRGPWPGSWDVSWQITNRSGQPLRLESAWVPHARFRGEGRLNLARPLAPGDHLDLELPVHAQEAPGTVVENAFLILRLSVAGVPWRVFVRMRVEFDAEATPHPIPELVTLQSARAAE